MTKEEAIKIIDEECEHIKHHLTEKGKAEEFYIELGNMVIAFNMAIKVLEQKSSDDVISRDFVKYEYRRRFIENLTDHARGIDLTKYVDIDCEKFNEFIDSIPSTVPQPMCCPNCGTKLISEANE